MNIIIVEKDNQISHYFSQIDDVETQLFTNTRELLAASNSANQITIVKSDDNPVEELKEVCERSFFTIFLTKSPNEVLSTKAYSLPQNAKLDLVYSSIQAMSRNIKSRNTSRSIGPLPHEKYENPIYASLKKDMIQDAKDRVARLNSAA